MRFDSPPGALNATQAGGLEILFTAGPFRAGEKGIGHNVGYLEEIYMRVAHIVDQFEAL